ncbi:MAG TPA: ferritin-like domain-containing protein [Flavobacterium sp.]|jgi:hypothetical protein|nr:ferritin-like domain-containing protein [Flavobacterium sp.]
MKNEAELQSVSPSGLKSRREFFKISGIAVAGAGLLLSCNNDDDNGGNPQDSQLPGMRNGVFDLGGGDLGILTYAYALEQLEAEFSTRVVTATGFTTAFDAMEQQMMMDIYNHEVVHREFFRNLLTDLLPDPSTQLLPNLQFNFGNLNFSDRNAVLQMANTLEETGIAAYNGAGKYITDPENLNIAGKIVSVEGRHASAIRQLMNNDHSDFAPTPLDPARSPSQILGEINNMNLIVTDFTATHLQ